MKKSGVQKKDPLLPMTSHVSSSCYATGLRLNKCQWDDFYIQAHKNKPAPFKPPPFIFKTVLRFLTVKSRRQIGCPAIA